ncbi:hypothetical protein J2Z48_000927 [Croceifilum oryzae]|uniref:Uncharacterized protein n=1 Tax=Croceifilum oryzae TaxID=1553429 RepID=A0AAJ1TLD3_9BACL|nr:hypothetical protein [Croceifilum oryzae]
MSLRRCGKASPPRPSEQGQVAKLAKNAQTLSQNAFASMDYAK